MHRILYHMDADGYASGAIVATALLRQKIKESDIVFHPINYGHDLPEIDYEKDQVYMVDFSLQPDEKMVEFVNKLGDRLVWIDHHRSAIDIESKYSLQHVKGIRAVTFKDLGAQEDERKVAACELTWKYFFEASIPTFIRLIGEWDTFRWKDMEHSDGPAMMMFLKSGDFNPKREFKWWEKAIYFALDFPDKAETLLYEEYIPIGNSLLRYQASVNKGLMFSKAFEANFSGYRAVLINQGGNSEMFNALYDTKKHDLMVTFQFIQGKYWAIGLYTATPERVHCGKLAKKLGEAGPIPSGGGHVGAAGFQCDWEYFWGLVKLPE